MNRIIGQFGGAQPGPLVIIIGALHGNEPAGVGALQEVFAWLNRADRTLPGLDFKGRLIGLIGHRQAFIAGQRYLGQDLNRLWEPAVVQRIIAENPENLREEELEIYELYTAIRSAVASGASAGLVMLDLHTTSAAGGIFCIPTDETGSLALAGKLHTPVILDLLKGLRGTLLGFAAAGYFSPDGGAPATLGVAFEAGQHNDPLSVDRCISAVLHALRGLGCIGPEVVDPRYDVVLQRYSAGLPRVTRLLYVHHVQPGDHFRMRPGYLNFQAIRAGEPLADDDRGPILAQSDGLILMPLYQPQGRDGFFVVSPEGG